MMKAPHTHARVHTHARTHARTHTHTHTRQSKAYGSHNTVIAAQYTNTGMPGTTQPFKPSVANPLRAGLVTHRRTVQVSWLEVTEPVVPQQPHTSKQDKDSLEFASQVYTRSPFYSWVNWSNVSKFKETHMQVHMHACTHIRTQTHTHKYLIFVVLLDPLK